MWAESRGAFLAGADPGFPVEGVADYRGLPTYHFAKCSMKMREFEKILWRREAAGSSPIRSTIA